MESDRWKKVEQLYHAALELPESERAAFVANACAGEEALQHEVGSLLAEAKGETSFLEAPAEKMAAEHLNGNSGFDELTSASTDTLKENGYRRNPD